MHWHALSDSNTILTIDALYEHTHRHAFAGGRAAHADRIGLELEMFAYVRGGVCDTSSNCRRTCIARVEDLLTVLEKVGASQAWDVSAARLAVPRIAMQDGATITLEPGGQIEYSTSPHSDVVAALDDVDRMVALLESHLDEAGMYIRIKGYNNECDVDSIGLQLDAPRYRQMDAYFASIGPFGREMMRATASLQINLDFGADAVTADRWRLANMIAPSMNALFANAPHLHDGVLHRSYRSEIWKHVDRTRTGRLFDKPDLDPVADYLRFALDARVMLIADDELGCSAPPVPMSFREWIDMAAKHSADDRPSDARRRPTIADWELHLSTLFPDVRARGSMELRSIDALANPQRRVAVALVTTLIYNDTARHEALHRIESRERTRVPSERQHGGYWSSDLATGRELMSLALPYVDARLRADCDAFARGLRIV